MARSGAKKHVRDGGRLRAVLLELGRLDGVLERHDVRVCVPNGNDRPGRLRSRMQARGVERHRGVELGACGLLVRGKGVKRQMVFNSYLESSGECRSCGCTDEEACPGGCVWATPAADLCSRCARTVDPFGNPAPGEAALLAGVDELLELEHGRRPSDDEPLGLFDDEGEP